MFEDTKWTVEISKIQLLPKNIQFEIKVRL